jgi:uncharacterized membrane protein
MFRRSAVDADWGKTRLEALSDGVFAIAMTLLVFNIKMPEGLTRKSTNEEVLKALGSLTPGFVAFGISFLILAAMWMSHHNVLHAVRKADRGIIWLNALYLAWVSLMPFSTSVYSVHLKTQAGLMVYWVNVFLAATSLALIWLHAVRKRKLLSEEMTPILITNISLRVSMMPVVSLTGIVVTMIDSTAALYVVWLLPVSYRIAGAIMNKRLEKATPAEQQIEAELA